MFIKLITDFCIKDDKEIKDYILTINNKLDMKYDKIDYLNGYLNNYYSDTFLDNMILGGERGRKKRKEKGKREKRGREGDGGEKGCWKFKHDAGGPDNPNTYATFVYDLAQFNGSNVVLAIGVFNGEKSSNENKLVFHSVELN